MKWHTLAYKLELIKGDIRAYFNPRQKWLTKVIPNTWCDKVELVPRVLFAILIDFVEEEKGTNQLNVDWSDELANGYITQEYIDNHNAIYTEILNAYLYVKNERPLLLKAHEDSYPEVIIDERSFRTVEPYEIAYAENNRLEKEIEEKDMAAMMTVVKHHKVLWT